MPGLPPETMELILRILGNKTMPVEPSPELAQMMRQTVTPSPIPTGFDQPNVTPHPAVDSRLLRELAENPYSPGGQAVYNEARGRRPPTTSISQDPWFDQVSTGIQGRNAPVPPSVGSTGLPRDIKQIFAASGMPQRGDGGTYLTWLTTLDDGTLERVLTVAGYDPAVGRDPQALRSLAGRLAMENLD